MTQPTTADVDAMLAQLQADRLAPYWADRGAQLDGVQSWLESLRDHVEVPGHTCPRDLLCRAPGPHREFQPRVIVQQVGPHRWETYVETGPLTAYAGEYGTYAFTEQGATKKGHRLLRRYLATRTRNRRDVTP